MIKHFGIWPLNCDKNNLFEEQKIFIIYLMGLIPEHAGWAMQVDYQKKRFEIKNMKDVFLEKSEIDLAKMQGRNISELKKEKLKSEKIKRLYELDKEFGIEPKEKDGEDFEIKPNDDNQKQKLWEILQGKGLVKHGL